MITRDAVIIGGGLFGRIIEKALVAQGRKVMIIDANMKEAGSKPAACLMKPSWFSSMGADVYGPSLELLDELYGVKDIHFQLKPSNKTATVHWIPPDEILNQWEYTMWATVTDICPKTNIVTYENGEGKGKVAADLVVVSAGIWTEKLLPQYQQVGQKGAAFLRELPDRPVRPFIKPWAPYRQLVAFNRGDGLWVGDGTAIKAENWTTQRFDTSYKRCDEAVGGILEYDKTKSLLGIRPYAKKHKPCLLEQVRPGLWVASGGAKNGTIAAGYCAHVISTRTE